jgi:hypothetical protein
MEGIHLKRNFLTGAIALVAAMIAGCASPSPAPLVKPATPSAWVADSATGGGRGGGAFFFVAAADGKAIETNNLSASLAASSGRGADLQIRPVARYLPAGKTTLKLAGRYAHAAPIQSLFSSAASYSVDGTIEAELRDDARYRVVGTLDAFKREIWLEDEASGAMVGQKVVALADKATANAADSLFTCCNLRYDGDWISDANWATLPIIPAGSRIQVKDYASNRASVLIEGRPMRIGLDYGREQESVQKYVARVAVKEDPRQKLTTYAKPVQDAILAGKVTIGMSKEQVIMSLGFPRADKTRSIEAAEWTYWTLDGDEYVLLWGPDQTLKSVDGARKIRLLVVAGE